MVKFNFGLILHLRCEETSAILGTKDIFNQGVISLDHWQPDSPLKGKYSINEINNIQRKNIYKTIFYWKMHNASAPDIFYAVLNLNKILNLHSYSSFVTELVCLFKYKAIWLQFWINDKVNTLKQFSSLEKHWLTDYKKRVFLLILSLFENVYFRVTTL